LGENRTEDIPQNEYLLKGSDKKKIRDSISTELFEIFFSSELKKHIIEAFSENELELTETDLNTYVGIGIGILTAFNSRIAIKDYWSRNLLLECPIVRSAMIEEKF